jgi:hypothetical protein
MEGNISIMDIVVDGPIFPRNRTHKVVFPLWVEYVR